MGHTHRATGAAAAATARRFSVYVVELHPAVNEFRKFREANPDCSRPRSCLYVGMTAHAPDVRFDQHKSGYKSGKYVKRYGLRLVPELYEHHNPLYYEDACRVEVQLAEALRNRGYAVWQN